MNYEDILNFWFGEIKDGLTVQNRGQLWYGSSADTDATIKSRYADRLQQADSGALDEWKKTARGRLALILLFDQFSRNIFRKSSEAFAFDQKAQALVLEGIELGHDTELQAIERSFFYMPLEHAEDLKLQALCVEKNKQLLADAPEISRSSLQSGIDYAIDHQAVIEKFGRFPHRNEVLERESTQKELEYLETANRYGQ